MPTAFARDDRLAADRAAAVGAEMRAPRHRRSALAGPRGTTSVRDCRQHRVELVQAVFERGDLAALLDQEVVAEGRTPIHLEREPAEVANPLLPGLQDRAALAAQGSRRGRAAHERRDGSGGLARPPAADAVQQGKTRHAGRESTEFYGPARDARRPKPNRNAMNSAMPTRPTTMPTQGITKAKRIPTMMSASARPIMARSFPSRPLPNRGGLDETWSVPPGRAVRPEAASSVGPIAIHYWASLRPCLGTAMAPRRRARFRQTLLVSNRKRPAKRLAGGQARASGGRGEDAPTLVRLPVRRRDARPLLLDLVLPRARRAAGLRPHGGRRRRGRALRNRPCAVRARDQPRLLSDRPALRLAVALLQAHPSGPGARGRRGARADQSRARVRP